MDIELIVSGLGNGQNDKLFADRQIICLLQI